MVYSNSNTDMKIYIISCIILIFLTSCSLVGKDTSEHLDKHNASNPDFIMLKWGLKSQDYNYEPWDYTTETRCGWRYDYWLNDIGYMDDDICTPVCETREKTDHRNDLFLTRERCLYYDYEMTDED